MSDTMKRRSPEEIFLLETFGTNEAILSGAHPLDLVQCLLNDTQYYMELLKKFPKSPSGKAWTAAERRRLSKVFRTQVAGLIDLYVVKGRGI